MQENENANLHENILEFRSNEVIILPGKSEL